MLWLEAVTLSSEQDSGSRISHSDIPMYLYEEGGSKHNSVCITVKSGNILLSSIYHPYSSQEMIT